MSASKIIGVRLNQVEQEMLEKCRNSSMIGDLGTSEYFRLLLHREYDRRFGTGQGKIKPSDAYTCRP